MAKRDTLTLLSVSLKSLNKSLVLKVGPACLPAFEGGRAPILPEIGDLNEEPVYTNLVTALIAQAQILFRFFTNRTL